MISARDCLIFSAVLALIVLSGGASIFIYRVALKASLPPACTLNHATERYLCEIPRGDPVEKTDQWIAAHAWSHLVDE